MPDVQDALTQSQAELIINKGGRGGITDHQLVMVDEADDAMHILQILLRQNKRVFVPVSTLAVMRAVETQLVANFPDKTVVCVWRDANRDVKGGLAADDPYTYIRDRGIDVLIATPILSTGFSIRFGWFDAVVGFFTALPAIVESYVQVMARVRGVRDRLLFAW